MNLESLYQEIILDHYKNPQGRGLQEDYAAEVDHINPTCGDEITLRARIDEDGTVHFSYEGQGCSISQASASILHDMLNGSTEEEIEQVHEKFLELMHGRGTIVADEEVLGDAAAFTGVAKYHARVKCALLAWMALQDAITQIKTAA